MKYGSFTAKHVDGFSLWGSPKSTYDVATHKEQERGSANTVP